MAGSCWGDVSNNTLSLCNVIKKFSSNVISRYINTNDKSPYKLVGKKFTCYINFVYDFLAFAWADLLSSQSLIDIYIEK